MQYAGTGPLRGRLPQGLPTVPRERIEGPCRGEQAQLVFVESGPHGELVDVAERTLGAALRDTASGCFRQPLDQPQAEACRRTLGETKSG